MNLLVINGPNLNMLGIREPEIYGHTTYAQLCGRIRAFCAERGIKCDIYQSNHEGDLIDAIQNACGNRDGIIINAGAYTHTSIALADALRAVGVPAVEVHISNTQEREAFRRISYIRTACVHTIEGMGINGYTEAIGYLIRYIENENQD